MKLAWTVFALVALFATVAAVAIGKEKGEVGSLFPQQAQDLDVAEFHIGHLLFKAARFIRHHG